MLMLGASLAIAVSACGSIADGAPTPTSEPASSELSQQLSPTSSAATESPAEITTVTSVDESTPESGEADYADTEHLTPVTSPPAQSADTSAQETEGSIDGGLQPIVQKAIDDLASRMTISPDDIVVMQAVSVVWPDGSLGCPQSGMEYTQVTVDGFHILLQASGTTHSYHGGGTSLEPFLCEKSKLP